LAPCLAVWSFPLASVPPNVIRHDVFLADLSQFRCHALELPQLWAKYKQISFSSQLPSFRHFVIVMRNRPIHLPQSVLWGSSYGVCDEVEDRGKISKGDKLSSIKNGEALRRLEGNSML
jgi:hypothetical protein